MPLDRDKARDVLPHAGFDVEGMLDRLADCVVDDGATAWWRDRCDAAEAQVSQVLALHFATASSSGPYAVNCAGCSQDWPCATARACGVTA